jgi:hypothetical protein
MFKINDNQADKVFRQIQVYYQYSYGGNYYALSPELPFNPSSANSKTHVFNWYTKTNINTKIAKIFYGL